MCLACLVRPCWYTPPALVRLTLPSPLQDGQEPLQDRCIPSHLPCRRCGSAFSAASRRQARPSAAALSSRARSDVPIRRVPPPAGGTQSRCATRCGRCTACSCTARCSTCSCATTRRCPPWPTTTATRCARPALSAAPSCLPQMQMAALHASRGCEVTVAGPQCSRATGGATDVQTLACPALLRFRPDKLGPVWSIRLSAPHRGRCPCRLTPAVRAQGSVPAPHAAHHPEAVRGAGPGAGHALGGGADGPGRQGRLPGALQDGQVRLGASLCLWGHEDVSAARVPAGSVDTVRGGVVGASWPAPRRAGLSRRAFNPDLAVATMNETHGNVMLPPTSAFVGPSRWGPATMLLPSTALPCLTQLLSSAN